MTGFLPPACVPVPDGGAEGDHVVHEYGETPPSEAVVEAIAAVTDQSGLDLPPLRTAVDPDALDDAVGDPGTRVRVQFTYEGRDVVVTPDRVYVEIEGGDGD